MISISKITDRLFVGNSHSARDIDTLKLNGITAIVNVAKDLSDPWIDGIKAFKFGLMDGDSPENDPEMFTFAAETTDTLLLSGETVLLHCHEGKSRSCAVALLIVLMEDYAVMSWEDAHNLIVCKRPECFIKPDTMSQAKRQFEKWWV